MAIHLSLPPKGEPGSPTPPIEPGLILVWLGVVVVILAIGGGVL